MKRDYDVIVIGAGPAGSSSAMNLVEKGIDILLLDKKQFPRDKPCGGIITEKTTRDFDYINGFKSIISKSKGAWFYAGKEPIGLTSMNNSMCFRRDFDNELLELVKKRGVFFRVESAMQVIPNENSVTVITGKNQYKCRFAVLATGQTKLVWDNFRLKFNPYTDPLSFVSEVEIGEKNVIKYYSEDRNIYFFWNIFDTAFYAWILPKKDTVNIGIPNYRAKSALFWKFVEFLKINNHLPEDAKIGKVTARYLPVYTPNRTIYNNNMFLVGDAARFVNGVNGEGIYYALKSGEVVAATISKLLDKTDHRMIGLQYERLINKSFGQELKFMDWFRTRVAKGNMARLLKINPTLIHAYKGDEDTFKQLTKGIIKTTLNLQIHHKNE